MKKILIPIMILLLASCDQVNQQDVKNVDYDLVIEAKEKFKQDTTLNVIIINDNVSNYVFEKGIDKPILKAHADYKTGYLVFLLFGVIIGIIIGWLIYIY